MGDQTAATAIPAVVVAGLVALLFDVSFTLVIVVAVVVILAFRLTVGGWRRLKSTNPVRPRPPREDL